jgi:hypothetical protein
MKARTPPTQFFLRVSAAVGLSSLVLAPWSGHAQLTPAQIDSYRNLMGSRVEALTVLGGDYGLAGATYNGDNDGRDTTINVNKFGGSGDIGDPMPLGDTGIGWQPRLQGSMGKVDSTTQFKGGVQGGDKSVYHTFAIQFGGGARFWFNDHLSIAPTFMGMYGHSKNDYTARSAFGVANAAAAKDAGLIDWDVDTWTVRPAGNLQYVYTWHRTIFTLASDFAYFHTESFRTSNSDLNVDGDSETWRNMIDVDVPLGKQLWGHELRTGGYFSRTELYDDIETGLHTDHIYEIHGRVVLDFLGELWKVQWIGIGVSYLWGSNFTGWSYGADVAFRF